MSWFVAGEVRGGGGGLPGAATHGYFSRPLVRSCTRAPCVRAAVVREQYKLRCPVLAHSATQHSPLPPPPHTPYSHYPSPRFLLAPPPPPFFPLLFRLGVSIKYKKTQNDYTQRSRRASSLATPP